MTLLSRSFVEAVMLVEYPEFVSFSLRGLQLFVNSVL
jgi:hypothetical protein